MLISSEISTLRLSFTLKDLAFKKARFRSIKPAVMVIFLSVITLIVIGERTAVAQGLQDDSGLSRHLANKITDEVLPHLNSGDYESFLFPFAEIISKVPSEVQEKIEAFGQNDSGISFRSEFFKAWQDVVLSGDLPDDFKFKRTVLMYLTSSAVAETERLTNKIEKSTLMMTNQVPSDWKDSRYFFIDMDELKSRIVEHETMGLFVNQSLETYRNARNPTKELEATLEEFEAASMSFAKTKKQVLEKEAEMRLQRFNTAAEELLQPNGFEEGLTSALFFKEDFTALKAFFDNATDIESPKLNALGVEHSIVQTLHKVKASGNPIIEKAALFAKGLDQWRRGRYGMGPAGSGLLKSKSVGKDLNGVRAKLASHALQMPETLAPISTFLGNESGEGYDRKHYYTWDLEYRPLKRRYATSSDSSISESLKGFSSQSEQLVCSTGTPYTRHTYDSDIERTTVTTNRVHTYADFDPQDDTIPPRIVGTYEYKTSLELLDKLVTLSTPDQIEVYDKIIAQLPEFAFFSGMTANINQPQAQPQFQPVAAGNDPPQNANAANQLPPVVNDFKKQSLAWMMALARVELNATRSMYLSGDSRFVFPPTSTFGHYEYYSVLLDDVAVHLKALESDKKFAKAIKKSMELASSATVSYLRRLKLIDSGLVALQRLGEPMVAQRSIKFRKAVKDYTEVLQNQVARSVQDSVQSTTGQKTDRFNRRGFRNEVP